MLVAEGRAAEASAAVIDSQSAKTTGVGGPQRGYDGAKRLKGRKRHVLVDTMGLVLLACVHAADLHDRDGARLLVGTAAPNDLPHVELVWADRGLHGRVRALARGATWMAPPRSPWLGPARRLSKDYERLPEVSEAIIYGAISRLMLRRLTRADA